jgi:peptidoglycan-associated lipoprotein
MLVALLVGACAGSKKTAPTPPATTVPPVQPNATAPVATVAAPVASTPATTAATVPSVRLVYFDFDSSEIRPEFTAPIAEHARALSRNASIKVRLEGHTDERGSREYNIGLGERRAQSVRRALLLQGVAEGQLTTLSYGEEKPAAAGSSEAAWAKNRRVELVYLN